MSSCANNMSMTATLCENNKIFAAASGFGVAYLRLDTALPLPSEVHWVAAGVATAYMCDANFTLMDKDTGMAGALGFIGGMIAMRMR
jgi:hypothetical protein